MDNRGNETNKGNKKLVVLLSVLAGIVAVLVIAILVVHNLLGTTKQLTLEQWDEKYEMESMAYLDCDDLSNAYNSGMMTEDEVERQYQEFYEKTDSNFYKVRLTLCYADYMYNKNHNLDETVAKLTKIEPLIEDTDDYVDYYDRLIVYYVDADDWDKVYHYAELRNVLFPDGDEVTYDELVTDESDLAGDGRIIEEEERIENNENGEVQNE